MTTFIFPRSFSVGRNDLVILVSPEDLKGHLRLLHAFYELRETIETGEDNRLPESARNLEKAQRWTWFVHLAVERFTRWVQNLRSVKSAQPLKKFPPPMDVWMVLHTYLLNPVWYAEDCERVDALKGLRDLSRSAIPNVNFGQVAITKPSPNREAAWSKATDTPFDPIDASAKLSEKTITCPKCRTVLLAPFLDDRGAGYAQQNFSVLCTKTSCRFQITKEKLAAVKFVKNLFNDDLLAATLDSPIKPDSDIPALIKEDVKKAADLDVKRGDEGEDLVLNKVRYSMRKLKSAVTSRLLNQEGLVNKMMEAYFDDRPFSVDLVGAVLRQGSFIQQMHDLGWTDSSHFDTHEEQLVLQHAVARYHAFLDLMASSPSSFLVPTLDIDLAWHTHQLKANTYNTDCVNLLGRTIDHDDKVGESRLATSFDDTCRLWQARFNVPYMYCGCPLPGKTVGQKLSRLVSQHFKSMPPPFLRPSDQADFLSGTHPSDHNAMYFLHDDYVSESARRLRVAEIDQRRQRDAERAKRNESSIPPPPENDGHHPAFLIPVPMFTESAACSAVSGNVVDLLPRKLPAKCRTGVESVGVVAPVKTATKSSKAGRRSRLGGRENGGGLSAGSGNAGGSSSCGGSSGGGHDSRLHLGSHHGGHHSGIGILGGDGDGGGTSSGGAGSLGSPGASNWEGGSSGGGAGGNDGAVASNGMHI